MTYDLYNDSIEIDPSISGAFQFFHDQNGYTGSFNLKGAGYADYFNSEGAAINGVLNVTGNQQIDGNFTGYGRNNFTHLINTGTAYLANVTGTATFNNLNGTGQTDINQFINGIRTSGNSVFFDEVSFNDKIRQTGNYHLEGQFQQLGNGFITGDLAITGGLTVNGVQITGGAIGAGGGGGGTGDLFSEFTQRGDLAVGTGNGTGAILTTGSTSSGWKLQVDPSSEFGISWIEDNGSSSSLNYFTDDKVGKVAVFKTLLGAVDANSDVNIQPRGTGAFFLGPTGTLQGNKRGSRAVDLQLLRTQAEQVAGSEGASILGGENNEISDGNYAVVLGGYSNTIHSTFVGAGSSNYSLIGGFSSEIDTAADSLVLGTSNTLDGSAAQINYSYIIGSNNTITKSNVRALGSHNTVSAANASALGMNSINSEEYSTTLGFKSTATRYGEVVQSAGSFGAALGNPQRSVLISRNSTSDATQTELYLNGSSKKIVIPTNTTAGFEIYITARRTDAGGVESARYKIEGLISREGNNTALIGSITTTTIAEDDASWSVTATADDTNEALAIKVTGASGKTIRWAAETRLLEVKDS